ncbi:formimidoylglutamate deiminase [Devosia sp. YIM 151766]|uniref:formimidoylglutamate deiminase n=1 Tax=Devosia sp. YIM 151766 TaxID=3017325 RepID=UPI00255D0DF3|nr:formimidoylglutamate deiminase [Devosia sp. YIM 151766]WIY53883.1 formimidoylglutamate deiminase [Devosia sp. YIM 151766]
MTTIFATSALLDDGWYDNVRITLAKGRIASIEPSAQPQGDDECHEVIVPGMANLHSHAFQRAMAGLTEFRGPTNDTFWSWRTIMYDMSLRMTPESVEAVAALLYMEMLEAGFCRVGEFHYLHHDMDGRPYDNIAELAERIAAASEVAGIGLTLLPVFYAHAGFGGMAPIEGQRRFINSLDSFERLMAQCRSFTSHLDGFVLGVAPHSLRAVTAVELLHLLAVCEDGPVHIHVAEQTQEVEDSLAHSGARPVQWLLANMPVDQRWCLIHATHMTETETRDMVQAGAVAGLCPITEANLGDGIFPCDSFTSLGGRFGVGSDSNVQISLSGELRMLEYSQRLSLRARNVLARPEGSTGRNLFDAALVGGAQALGVQAGIAPGCPADMVALDQNAVPYLAKDRLLDSWIFAEQARPKTVWARGRKLVENGRHVRRQEIERAFSAAMQALTA